MSEPLKELSDDEVRVLRKALENVNCQFLGEDYAIFHQIKAYVECEFDQREEKNFNPEDYKRSY